MTIHHALVLNLHQPPGNLEHLLDHQDWEAKEILFAYDRIARSLWDYSDVGRVHLSVSGTLLETLSSPGFQERVYGIVDCGSVLWHWQNQSIIDILGTGYYHPVLPLIPERDRLEHLKRWQGIAGHVFWRQRFNGFWPPEMGFSMELIPVLRKCGYRYVIVDSEHVEPVTPMAWQEIRYRPHIARHGSMEIIVIVRDRDLSDAQEAGMEPGWFESELKERTKWCNFEPLVTTCTDGENGGWFRNTTHEANFWGAFYQPLLAAARRGGDIQPAFIHDYLDRYGVFGEVKVKTGAWNTGWHHGRDFTQWTGSEAQKHGLAELQALSDALHAELDKPGAQAAGQDLDTALWRLLRAETSCNFYWGEDWVGRARADLEESRAALARHLATRLPQRRETSVAAPETRHLPETPKQPAG